MGFGLLIVLGGSANNWWLRSANSSTNFRYVNNNGNNNNNNASNSNGVVLGSSFARQSNPYIGRNPCDRREGARNPPERVNMFLGKSGRTLLAWRWLNGNPPFHAH